MAQTLGLHPWHLPSDLDAALQRLADRATALRPDGIGETGLDRARRSAGQERALDAQAALARALNLPLVLHVVRAHGAVRRRVAGLRGLVHDVACDPQEVARWVDAGFLLSVSVRGLRRPDCLRAIPDDALLLESDDGDDDAWTQALLGVAALRGQDPDAVAATTADNAARLFPWLAGQAATRGHDPRP